MKTTIMRTSLIPTALGYSIILQARNENKMFTIYVVTFGNRRLAKNFFDYIASPSVSSLAVEIAVQENIIKIGEESFTASAITQIG